MDPVTLGLCSQIDLDFEVNRAAKDRPAVVEDHGQTLVPASVTTSLREPSTTEDVFGKPTTPAQPVEEEEYFDAERVFGRAKDVESGE